MQERRSTIRIEYPARAQYCPSEDLIPRDGRMTNLSERGANLLARETHRLGERITVSFPLPEEEEPLTVTGVVRWSDPSAQRGRWHAMGIEWLPLGETTSHRLHAFLGRAVPASLRPAVASSANGRAWTRRLATRTGILFGLLFGLVLARWALTVQQDNRQLGVAIQQRNAIIHQLEQRETQLQQALTSTQTQLAVTVDEVSRLSQQTKGLEEEAGLFHEDVERLNQEVERFQQAYVQTREEREQLIQRVMDLEQERTQLEQERTELTRRLSSLPDLRRAIREAIEERRSAQRRERLLTSQGADHELTMEDNQGYLVRDGAPTQLKPSMWIRVYEPEPPAAATP